MLREYDSVFNPHFSGYNGAVGPLEATVNMGPYNPCKGKAEFHNVLRINSSPFKRSLMN
jgi:hypothetical protein